MHWRDLKHAGNEFLERVSPEELEEIQKDLAYTMIRRKTFDDARVLKKWQIIIDGTELDEGYQNQIPFGAFDVNLIYYKEKKVLGGVYETFSVKSC